MAQGSVKPANQRGRGTLIALSNNRGPLLFSRLSDVAVRSLGVDFPFASNHVLTACDQSAIAWIAVVFPQLLGPMSTAG